LYTLTNRDQFQQQVLDHDLPVLRPFRRPFGVGEKAFQPVTEPIYGPLLIRARGSDSVAPSCLDAATIQKLALVSTKPRGHGSRHKDDSTGDAIAGERGWERGLSWHRAK
jgi:hypothetical protein